MTPPTYRKKLIEVALPLEAINRESAREKSIRHGHPSTLHLWWARRPLAACRAVIFASLVDDPSSRPEEFPTEEAQDRERQRLFALIEELVKWENTSNTALSNEVWAEILRGTDGDPPPVYDPFCGGGSIPIEAKRLGLEAHGSDLNPVPVLLTKALVEYPDKFSALCPVNPSRRETLFSGTAGSSGGLASDITYYGKWLRDEAERRIGHLYPDVKIPSSLGGGSSTAVAWIWARTVVCPSPACGAQMPLVRSFELSTKKGKEWWIEARVDRTASPPAITFNVRRGAGAPENGTVTRRGVTCLACGAIAPLDHVRVEAKAGRMGQRMMAIVANGNRERIYVSPTHEHEQAALVARPANAPSERIPTPNHDVDRLPMYGMETWADAFTNRQLTALVTLSELIASVPRRVTSDCSSSFAQAQDSKVDELSKAIATYLAFAVSKAANLWSSITTWMNDRGALRETFARQAIPMTWDFAEVNPFNGGGGDIQLFVERIADVVAFAPVGPRGLVQWANATSAYSKTRPVLVSTDPPYYDNISYADLSDFFYVWLRRCIGDLHPELLSTLVTPKNEELVATPYRFGGDRTAARQFFESGLRSAFANMRAVHDERFPLTVYYAFKQAESREDGDLTAAGESNIVSTGWETMLEGLISSGLLIDGTWPVRTESPGRAIARGANALASSIVLVCRSRSEDAPTTTRRQLLTELRSEMPDALRKLQHGSIAPVDLAQAAIGPGMAIFSRYGRVLESDGTVMRVGTALSLINQILAELLVEHEGELDADTRWALTWFDQYGFAEGPYGDAEVLAKAKVTSVQGLSEAGIIVSARGKVRLLKRDELLQGWNPAADSRRTVWEATHHLIRALENEGEQSAATLLAQLGEDAEGARDLAYRLYTTCERRSWAQDAQAYNSLAVAWPELSRLASSVNAPSSSSSPQESLGI